MSCYGLHYLEQLTKQWLTQIATKLRLWFFSTALLYSDNTTAKCNSFTVRCYAEHSIAMASHPPDAEVYVLWSNRWNTSKTHG